MHEKLRMPSSVDDSTVFDAPPRRGLGGALRFDVNWSPSWCFHNGREEIVSEERATTKECDLTIIGFSILAEVCS